MIRRESRRRSAEETRNSFESARLLIMPGWLVHIETENGGLTPDDIEKIKSGGFVTIHASLLRSAD